MAARNRLRNVEYDHVQRSLVWKAMPQEARRPVKSTMGKDHLWEIIESNLKASMCSPPVRCRGKKHYYGNTNETPYGHDGSQRVTYKQSKKQVNVPASNNRSKPGKRVGYRHDSRRSIGHHKEPSKQQGKAAPKYSQNRAHLWATDNHASRAQQPREEDSKRGRPSMLRYNRSQRSTLTFNGNPRPDKGHSRRRVIVGAAHRDQVSLRDGGTAAGKDSTSSIKNGGAQHPQSSARLAWGPQREGVGSSHRDKVCSHIPSKGKYYKNSSQIQSW